MRTLLASLLLVVASFAQQAPGKAAYDAFQSWRETAGTTEWSDLLARYRVRLGAGGLDEAAIARALEAVEAYDEGAFYDAIYTNAPTFNTAPNRLLVESVKGRRPGLALDIAMGQGRNSLYLAGQGWTVTGFDVSATGLATAQRTARARSLTLTTVHAYDGDFDFGEARWDLIAMLYPMEKRSARRIASALKPGGLVVVEVGRKDASGAPFEVESGELLRIFNGFRVLRYEETIDVADWSGKRIPLVRLVAEKPR